MNELKKLLKKLKKVKYLKPSGYTIEKDYRDGKHGRYLSKMKITLINPNSNFGIIKIFSYSSQENTIHIKFEKFLVNKHNIDSGIGIALKDADEALKIIKKFSKTEDPNKLMNLFRNLHKKYK